MCNIQYTMVGRWQFRQRKLRDEATEWCILTRGRGAFFMIKRDFNQQLRLWADELHAIANEGMRWESQNPYQVHRYDRVRRIAAELFAAQDTRSADEIEQLYRGALAHIAPYPVGDAAVFNERGEILLIQRADNKLWAMPGGAFEVGETPAEGACREAWEETGVAVEALQLIGVYDSRRCNSTSNNHLYHFVFLCRPRDAAPQPVITNETLAVGWYAEEVLPALSPGHVRRVADAFRCWRSVCWEAVFD